MSQSDLQRFLERLSESEALRAELGIATPSKDTRYVAPEAFLAAARRHGFEFSLEELRSHPSSTTRELSEGELESVAGGAQQVGDHVGSYNFKVEIEGATFDANAVDSMGRVKVRFHWDR